MYYDIFDEQIDLTWSITTSWKPYISVSYSLYKVFTSFQVFWTSKFPVTNQNFLYTEILVYSHIIILAEKFLAVTACLINIFVNVYLARLALVNYNHHILDYLYLLNIIYHLTEPVC